MCWHGFVVLENGNRKCTKCGKVVVCQSNAKWYHKLFHHHYFESQGQADVSWLERFKCVVCGVETVEPASTRGWKYRGR